MARFVEIEGMVFMEGTIENEEDRQRLVHALEEYDNNRTLTEQAFNLYRSTLYPSKSL